MIVTVFRSRLDPTQKEAYKAMSATMVKLVSEMPGLLSYKSYEATDGERVTIVEFKDEASHNLWRDHPKHQKAMELGKTTFYEEYKVQVCNVIRESSYSR